MIKTIFAPERIGSYYLLEKRILGIDHLFYQDLCPAYVCSHERFRSYYLFEKRILGIDLCKTNVVATLVVAKGRTVTLEKSIVVPLDPGTPTNYDERAIKALHSALEQIDRF